MPPKGPRHNVISREDSPMTDILTDSRYYQLPLINEWDHSQCPSAPAENLAKFKLVIFVFLLEMN